jgi:hypothetical protein
LEGEGEMKIIRQIDTLLGLLYGLLLPLFFGFWATLIVGILIICFWGFLDKWENKKEKME